MFFYQVGFSKSSDFFMPITMRFASTLVLASSAELYCPDVSSYQMDGGCNWDGNGWTCIGQGGTHGVTSFNLLGGYIEFDMDSSGSSAGMNNNFYTISPDSQWVSHDASYCDAQCPNGNCCMEMDIIEMNGNVNGATTWHSWTGNVGGCDAGGCAAEVDVNGQFHVRSEWDTDGWMHVYFNGNEVNGYNPFPNDDAKRVAMETFQSQGGKIESTQWNGWVPGCGDGCGPNNPNARFSVQNVKISGTVVMGPEPKKCSAPTPFPSPLPPTPPTPVPPTPSGVGKCGYDCSGGCNTCTGWSSSDFCVASQGNCEGSCTGKWCGGSVPPSRRRAAPQPSPPRRRTPAPSPVPVQCGNDDGNSLNHCVQNCPGDTFADCIDCCEIKFPDGPSPSPAPTTTTTTTLKPCGDDDGADLAHCVSNCPTDIYGACIACCEVKFPANDQIV